MYYVHYDQNGNIIGFYTLDIHGDNIPTPNIALTQDQWQDCVQNPRRRKVDVVTKQIIICEPPAPTKEELLTKLDAQYKPQFDDLARALSIAILRDDQDMINSIKTDYQTLKQEYQVKREAIING